MLPKGRERAAKLSNVLPRGLTGSDLLGGNFYKPFAPMKKENTVAYQAPMVRLTRARAAAARASLAPDCPSTSSVGETQQQQRVLRGKLKRAADVENSNVATAPGAVQQKRRAVLRDVSNICGNSYKDCISGVQIQSKNRARIKPAPAETVIRDVMLAEGDGKGKMVEEVLVSGSVASQEAQENTNNEDTMQNTCRVKFSEKQVSRVASEVSSPLKAGNNMTSKECMITSCPDYVDIDSNLKNRQMCSLYAVDIYDNLRVLELIHRPSSNFMETIQRDINPSMRAILVDWLVEVAQEYRLVPDTLYLTVYIVDSFLSQKHIERPRLQLLGVTSMLIASKYEEQNVRHVEDFCFITDYTYHKEEVLKMEIEVLNCLEFRLSVPTTETFLRRFLQAVEASCMVSISLLESMASYLAELTLIDYAFLKFIPSRIAASAVFLALWSLDQSGCPWNSTLEHYTFYKASDLKATVLAMRSLQWQINNCPLRAIQDKYSQPKFKSVATLATQELPPSLF